MPELPDLLYINTYLSAHVRGRKITGVEIRQPVVVRNPFPETCEDLLRGSTVTATRVRGPFLVLSLSCGKEVILNLMLAGHLHHQRGAGKPPGWLCLSLKLDDLSLLHLADEQKMAKLYLAEPGATAHIPRFDTQGVDILAEEFTEEALTSLAARHRRKQVRVFLNDQTILSAIGNAYADEILFEARIHPKTLVASLEDELPRLYAAIHAVIEGGIEEVRRAGQPIHVKVRDHMKVRNRKGTPCPRCGTTIRREGVRGYDVFFCPACQPSRRKSFIEWRNAPDSSP
jgi:formamidopyrimidine-DNA glycosylase